MSVGPGPTTPSRHPERFRVVTVHGERDTIYHALDSAAPEPEQPAIVRSWRASEHPNAHYLAHDYCARHNTR